MAIVSHCCTDLCFCVFSRQQFLESAQDVGPKWSLCYSLLQCVAVRWGIRAVESVINLKICYSSCRLMMWDCTPRVFGSARNGMPHMVGIRILHLTKKWSHISTDEGQNDFLLCLLRVQSCSVRCSVFWCVLVCFPVRAAVRVALFALLRASSCASGMGRLM